MAITNSLIFRWDDHRSSYGNVTRTENRKDRVYNDDDNLTIRFKFATLLIVQMPYILFFSVPLAPALVLTPLSAFRAIYRVGSLLTGDFVRAGYQIANNDWQLERQQWSLQEKKETPLPPSRVNLYFKITKHVTCQLIKNIVKIVTEPLANIARLFALVYGMYDPIDGRGLYAYIEDLWSRETLFDGPMPIIGDYSAACMQPFDVFKKNNWYRWAIYPYDDQEFRSLIFKIQNLLIEKEMFFQNEGIGKDLFDVLKKARKEYTKSDKDERSHLDQSKDIFNKVYKTLQKIEMCRDDLVTYPSYTSSMEKAKKDLARHIEKIIKLKKN